MNFLLSSGYQMIAAIEEIPSLCVFLSFLSLLCFRKVITYLITKFKFSVFCVIIIDVFKSVFQLHAKMSLFAP